MCMSFTATVLRVAIASPSDVQKARNAVEKSLHDWNAANSVSKRVILLPWRWETDSVPLLGNHPQDIINNQGIDSADILVAIFGSRLGAPTKEAVSGTVEEIERAQASGKPVHVYFSTAPLPRNIDTNQFEGLRKFSSELRERGLYGEFETVEQLGHEIWKAVEYDVNALDTRPAMVNPQDQGVVLRVQSRADREAQGLDRKGKMKYVTKHWYEITNEGDVDAKNMTFAMSEDTLGVILEAPQNAISLKPGTMWKLDVNYTLGMTQPRLVVSWAEDGEQKEQVFDVQ